MGATWDDQDQTPRFVAEGIWENGYKSGATLAVVRQIEPGDRIAIKAAFTRKRNLPFPNPLGEVVSVIRIKAVGTVQENLGDGRRLIVSWDPNKPARDWYFYTNRETIWRVEAGNEMAERLIAFAFDGEPQDYHWFLSQEYLRDRFIPASTQNPRTYTLEDALRGLFLERTEFERIIRIWRLKKNIVFKAPRESCKSFIGRRLAYALMGETAEDRVGAITSGGA